MKIYTIAAALLLARYGACLTVKKLPSVVSLRVSQRTETFIRVEWENPEQQVYSYFVVSIAPPEGEKFAPENAAETYWTFTGLTSGEAYVVTIKGITKNEDESDPVDYTVYTTPPKPSNLRVKPIDEVEISISMMGRELSYTATVVGLEIDWDAADPPNVKEYRITISPSEGVQLTDVSRTEAVPTKAVFTGLTPGEQYIISVVTQTGSFWNTVESDAIEVTRVIPPKEPVIAEIITLESTSVEIKTHGPISGIYKDPLLFELTPNIGTVGTPIPHRLYSMFDIYNLRNLKTGTKYSAEICAQSHGVKGKKCLTIVFTTVPLSPVLRMVSFDEEVIKLGWAHPVEWNKDNDLMYIVEYQDPVTGDTKIAKVTKLNKDDVQIDILGLSPGHLYTFKVKTVLNGISSAEPSQITQGTRPMRPVRSMFERDITGNIRIKFKQPSKGVCPTIKIFLSPPIPSSIDGVRYYPLGQEIIMTGIPKSKRYFINARCVSNNIEGEEASYPVDSKFNIKAPHDTEMPNTKEKLECSGKQRLARFEVNAENDACCGLLKPYNTGRAECCGPSGVTVSKNGGKKCCGDASYIFRTEECCDVETARVANRGSC